MKGTAMYSVSATSHQPSFVPRGAKLTPAKNWSSIRGSGTLCRSRSNPERLSHISFLRRNRAWSSKVVSLGAPASFSLGEWNPLKGPTTEQRGCYFCEAKSAILYRLGMAAFLCFQQLAGVSNNFVYRLEFARSITRIRAILVLGMRRDSAPPATTKGDERNRAPERTRTLKIRRHPTPASYNRPWWNARSPRLRDPLTQSAEAVCGIISPAVMSIEERYESHKAKAARQSADSVCENHSL